jgi:myo-inositol 2-dehydrogenase/D-chiro-inositol 1-dehydrogenase
MSDSPLKVALLGAGWFGREAHLRNLVSLDGVEVIAASSRGEDSLAAAREIAGNQLQTFTDWRDALKVEGLDAVVVALTNNQHHEAALAAFDAGLHVLCEKPLGLSIAECDDTC